MKTLDRIRILSAGLLVVLLATGLALGRVPPWAGMVYAGIGLISVLAYWADKRSAARGGWRIPEARLHLIDALGGIIGGLLAMGLFRHKTGKPGFRNVSFAIAALHALALGAVCVGVVL